MKNSMFAAIVAVVLMVVVAPAMAGSRYSSRSTSTSVRVSSGSRHSAPRISINQRTTVRESYRSSNRGCSGHGSRGFSVGAFFGGGMRMAVPARHVVMQAESVYTPVPQMIVHQQLQIPEGFMESVRDNHSDGSVDWIKGRMANGQPVKIEFNRDGSRKELKEIKEGDLFKD